MEISFCTNTLLTSPQRAPFLDARGFRVDDLAQSEPVGLVGIFHDDFCVKDTKIVVCDGWMKNCIIIHDALLDELLQRERAFK